MSTNSLIITLLIIAAIGFIGYFIDESKKKFKKENEGKDEFDILLEDIPTQNTEDNIPQTDVEENKVNTTPNNSKVKSKVRKKRTKKNSK